MDRRPTGALLHYLNHCTARRVNLFELDAVFVGVRIHESEKQKQSNEYKRADKDNRVERFVMNHVHEKQDHQSRFDGGDDQWNDQLQVA